MIELILVIAILGVLTGLAVPVIAGLINQSKVTVARQQVTAVQNATAAWIQDGYQSEKWTAWNAIVSSGTPNHLVLLSSPSYLAPYLEPATQARLLTNSTGARIQSDTMLQIGSTLIVTWPSSSSEFNFNYSE